MRIITTIFLILLLLSGNAQKKSLLGKHDHYQFNYGLDIAFTAAGLLSSKFGCDALRDRRVDDDINIAALSPSDIWWFDRGATKQNPLKAGDAIGKSNLLFRGALFMPAALLLDDKINDEWFDYILLYLEAQSFSAVEYQLAAFPVKRMRPFMYNPNEDMERKTGRNLNNSFFSGHTSVVATSTFFMAKVYCDFHPDVKNKVLIYGLAAIPPAITGYYRYKAGKHFPTDIITGYLLGAATGILVPELHKKKNQSLSLVPYTNWDNVGLRLRMVI